MRQVVLESNLNGETSRSPSPQPLTHFEEQQALRDETIKAFHGAVTDEDNDDGLLVLREKTKDEMEREEEEYRTFLEREVGTDLKELVTVEPNTTIWSPDDGGSQDDETQAKSQKKKDKKKANRKEGANEKKGKDKVEDDQEFLMK